MATEESISKRLKAIEEENDDEIDRLSTLPISLLCHILSFLPTKTSVCTMSLVSHIWLNLWKDLQVFDFSYNQNEQLFMFFTVFVNTVLSSRNSRDIRKFSLCCDYFNSYDNNTFYKNSIESWVRIASGPHLQEFDLHLIPYQAIDVPLTLLSCSNLVSLRLSGNIWLPLQDSSKICLPSLKVLKLEDIDSINVDSMNILLSACPILETMELSFYPDSLETLRVPSSLKWLEICVLENLGAFLEIDTPGLKFLRLVGIKFGDAAAVRNLHNVKEAYLDLSSTPNSDSVEPLLNLLRALSGIKYLGLESSTTEWLFSAPNLDFPEFRYLLHLKLILPSFNLGFLFDMLQKCPMLQTLQTFDKGSSSITDDSSSSYGWAVKPKSVPKCLISHLISIHFQTDQQNLHELEFIGYVLQNGLVLKTMHINNYVDPPEEWEKKISDLPRGSAMCQLKFYQSA